MVHVSVRPSRLPGAEAVTRLVAGFCIGVTAAAFAGYGLAELWLRRVMDT
jgi:hypothetical protein